MKPKSNRLSIYLIKPEYQSLDEIVESGYTAVPIQGIGHFVFLDSYQNSPKWIKDFFGSALDGSVRIFTASARGLLVTSIQKGGKNIYFALAFGVGRHLLKEGVFEERFGLKTTLNSVALEGFRSISKTSLGSVPKQSHEQMSRDVSPSDFGIDIEQDLISSVTGKSTDSKFGKTMTGKDALGITVKIDVTGLPAFLDHCLDRYESSDYKTNFDWIDQIAEVRTPTVRNELNDILVAKINAKDLSKVWMAVPELVNWSDLLGFRYGQPKRSELHEDLSLEDFIASLAGIPITMDTLKGKIVYAISVSTEDESAHWPAFRCIYAEIALRGQTFVLNNGKWYEIAQGFTDQVLSDYDTIQSSSLAFPDCNTINEGDYNKFAATSLPDTCCLDQNCVMHGGGHSKIEFCDLYTTSKKIIHIKKYGGSSVLSHLFSQGVVSGELFAGDSDFRKKLNEKLPDGHKLVDFSAKPNTSEYEVIFGIISNAPGQLEIPFFSKVSIRNARKRLQMYGYDVKLNKILQLPTPKPVTPN